MIKVASYFTSADMLKDVFFRAMNSLFVRCGECLIAEGKHVQTPYLNLESKIVMLTAVH